MKPRERLADAVRVAAKSGEPALIAFLTAGYPSAARFREHLLAVAAGSDVIEIGVPFTDPMADGVTIQRSSQAALKQGVSLKWILGELRRLMKDAGLEDVGAVPVSPGALAELAGLAERDVVSSTVAKDVLATMWATGRSAQAIVDAEGLAQQGESAELRAAIEAVLADHADAVAQYRAGKTATFGFLVGQAMKASKGKANPKVVNQLLKQALETQ